LSRIANAELYFVTYSARFAYFLDLMQQKVNNVGKVNHQQELKAYTTADE
jgi:hypothetical protein